MKLDLYDFLGLAGLVNVSIYITFTIPFKAQQKEMCLKGDLSITVTIPQLLTFQSFKFLKGLISHSDKCVWCICNTIHTLIAILIILLKSRGLTRVCPN